MYDCLSQRALSAYKFTGKERDTESGLDNFGARFDASNLGRFMSTDPGSLSITRHLIDPQGLNRYAYTRNNPVIHIDPDGKDWQTAWNDVKTFANSLYTKAVLGVGFGGHAQVGAGKVAAEASYTGKMEFRTGENASVTLSRTAEVRATAEAGAGGVAVGTAIGTTQVDATFNKDGVSGAQPAQPVEVSPSNTAGSADIDVSKEDVGIEDVPCALICAGVGIGATREGWSALGDAISNVKDEIILPTPPPPPTPGPPPEGDAGCQAGSNSGCNQNSGGQLEPPKNH